MIVTDEVRAALTDGLSASSGESPLARDQATGALSLIGLAAPRAHGGVSPFGH